MGVFRLRAWSSAWRLVRAACLALLMTAFFAGAAFTQTPPSAPAAGGAANAITFTRDIAPIVFTHCAPCHRPSQAAPFSLLTYEDARQHATQIASATQRRYMPPWKPEPGYGDFVGARGLSDTQIALIQQWVDQGLVEGDRAALPPARPWASGWQLGQPDLVVSMPVPYQLPGSGPDVFRTFVIPIPLTARRYVKSLEFNPINYRAVHHANIKVDQTRLSRQLDDDEPGPGYEGGGSREARFPDGNFLGWTPGQSPRVSEAGMAWHLEPDSDLVVELHLMPTGKPEPVQVSVGLFFTDEPPSRITYMLRLGRQDIDIAAGSRDYVNTDAYTLPIDVDVLGVQPHAHYLAQEVRGFARLPDGTTQWLIYIKAWDFHWQDVYRYTTPLSLPKGTTLVMLYTYDNSAANPRNPHSPPERVRFGQTSTSEMGSLWVQVLPRDNDDLQTLDQDFAPKMLQDDIDGDEKTLEVNPSNAPLHASLAANYLAAGRVADAIAHLEEAVRLDPTAPRQCDIGKVLLSENRLDEAGERYAQAAQLKPDFATAFDGLGLVRYRQGRLDEAIASYTRVLELDPTNAGAHYNSGRVLASQGKVAEAVGHYRQALQLRPDDAETHSSLGGLLALQNQFDEALTHYRRALQLQPDLRGALVDLAWILATSDRADVRAPGEAVRLGERVAALTQYQDATVLDVLAAAYAAAGQVDRAITTAQAAVQLASASGPAELVDRIRQRLDFYQQRKP